MSVFLLGWLGLWLVILGIQLGIKDGVLFHQVFQLAFCQGDAYSNGGSSCSGQDYHFVPVEVGRDWSYIIPQEKHGLSTSPGMLLCINIEVIMFNFNHTQFFVYVCMYVILQEKNIG